MLPSNSPLGKPLSNYREVLYWKISEDPRRLVLMNLLAVLLAIVFGMGFFVLIHAFGGSPPFALSSKGILIFLIGLPIVLALHEFVHGIIMRSLGARPVYGFWKKGLMFYAKAPGQAFKRNQYALIVLAPLLCLSIIACLGIVLVAGNSIVWVLALWAIVNASAANADSWITAVVLQYPRSACIVDEQDGMRIYLPHSGSMAE